MEMILNRRGPQHRSYSKNLIRLVTLVESDSFLFRILSAAIRTTLEESNPCRFQNMNNHALPCQVGFSSLSVSTLQPVVFAEDDIGKYDISSNEKRLDAAIVGKLDWNENSQVKYICPKSRTLLPAAEASVARLSGYLEAMDLDADYSIFFVQKSSDGIYDPVRPVSNLALQNMAPPKRFYQRFWRSVTRRLLHQSKQSAWPSAQSGPAQTQLEALA